MVSHPLCAAKFQAGFQTVGSVNLQVAKSLGGLRTMVPIAQLPCMQRNSRMSSGCGVFRGAD